MDSIDIVIDKLTNSIRNKVTGDSFITEVLPAKLTDIENLSGWNFDWKAEFEKGGVYKLVIKENESVIQGFIRFEERQGFIRVRLVESAPFNLGTHQMYQGVGGNLFAYAAKVSFEKGFEGNLAFIAKTYLVEHYKKSLLAEQVGNSLRMYLCTESSRKLVKKYFPDFNF